MTIYQAKHGGIPTGSIKPLKKATIAKKPNRDSVRTILVPGEMVIPRKYVPLVSNFLRTKHISFGNFK